MATSLSVFITLFIFLLTFLEVFSMYDNLLKIFYDISINLSPNECRKLKKLLLVNDIPSENEEDSCLYALLRWDEEFKSNAEDVIKILEKSLGDINRYGLAESLRKKNGLKSYSPGYSAPIKEFDIQIGYHWSYFEVLAITITVFTIIGTSFMMISFLVARMMKKKIELRDKRSGFIPKGPYDFSILYDYYTEEENSDDLSN